MNESLWPRRPLTTFLAVCCFLLIPAASLAAGLLVDPRWGSVIFLSGVAAAIGAWRDARDETFFGF